MKDKYKVKYLKNIGIILFIIMIIYFALSLYFINHFYFGTEINGVDISCKNIDYANRKFSNEIESYKLELKERDGTVEYIYSKDINLKYTPENKLLDLKEKQKPFKWILSLYSSKSFNDLNLISYNEDSLEKSIENLSCLNEENIIEPTNPIFKYVDNKYIILDEVYGNKIKKDILHENVLKAIKNGENTLNFDEIDCYEKPKYTAESKKAIEVKNKLNNYINTKIIYNFKDRKEILNCSTINQWLDVDEDLNIIFNKKSIRKYINELSSVYNTVSKTREFICSTGAKVKVTGGNYGWIINTEEEINELIKLIEQGQSIEKEPIYKQKALNREKNDIGKTYVEINFTKQHLWFYKDGKLITEGDVVTGNVSEGNSTPVGVYILNYKQRNATLKGDNYSTDVKFWMPFNGGIGIHDAIWRENFGGTIYKTNGSHGCVNAPSYLAKNIFDNIEPGIPIICYYE